jgi:phage gpG-like protein
VRIHVALDEASLAALNTRLQGIETRMAVLSPALDEIADDWLNIERARFAGRAEWKPLTPEWAARKAAGGRSPLPLAGGELERSLTQRGSRFAVRSVGQKGITLGTTDPVAQLHQSGSRRLPKRPPVSLSIADEKRWALIIQKHIAGRTPEVGL